MLLKIISSVIAFGIGLTLFWAVSFRLFSANRLGPNFISNKYLGFRSYGELRSHVLGANALWAPIVGIVSVFFLVHLGWDDAIWVCAFMLGYVVSFWRFLKKPKKAWDDESYPPKRS